MDNLKIVPWTTYPTPLYDNFKYIQMDDSLAKVNEKTEEVVKEWIARSQKDYNDMLVAVLNKHGIPFSPDKYEEYIGRLELIEYQDYTINGQIVVIRYDGKDVCKLKKWIEAENILDPTKTIFVQRIVEVE